MAWPPEIDGFTVAPVTEGGYQMDMLGLTLYDVRDLLIESQPAPESPRPDAFDNRNGKFVRLAPFKGGTLTIIGRFVEYSPQTGAAACLIWHIKPSGK